MITRKIFRFLAAFLALFFTFTFIATAPANTLPTSNNVQQSLMEKVASEGLAVEPEKVIQEGGRITRAEFVSLIARVFGKQNRYLPVCFSDVAPSDWFSQDVAWAKSAGYISGYPDGSFKPGEPVTRQEAALITVKLMALDTYRLENCIILKDAEAIPAWSRKCAYIAVENKIMAPFPDGTFKPQVLITGMEALSLINTAQRVVNKSSGNTVSANKDSIPEARELQKETGPASEDASSVYEQLIKNEADWIVSNQLPSGAIALYSPEKKKVIPYYGNLAGFGLAMDSSSAEPLRKYILWYLDRLAIPGNSVLGAVYDFIFNVTGREISTNDSDSVDSYGASFLSLVWAYYRQTKDKNLLLAHRKEIENIGESLISLQDTDGLTWAKPNYKIKYLMDNTEVYKGFFDLSFIEKEVYQDPVSSAFYAIKAEGVKMGIQGKLWQGEFYAYALDESGTFHNGDSGQWYPDAVSQLYPIWTGVIGTSTPVAKNIYNNFNKKHPGWPELKKDDPFPWSVVAYVAVLMGDKERAGKYLKNITESYLEKGRPWPWYPAESGFLILALKTMPNAGPGI